MFSDDCVNVSRWLLMLHTLFLHIPSVFVFLVIGCGSHVERAKWWTCWYNQHATEAFLVLWQLLPVWCSTKSPQDTTCFILAEDSHKKGQVSYETKWDLGNCFDYFFPCSQLGKRITKLNVEVWGRRDWGKVAAHLPAARFVRWQQ